MKSTSNIYVKMLFNYFRVVELLPLLVAIPEQCTLATLKTYTHVLVHMTSVELGP